MSHHLRGHKSKKKTRTKSLPRALNFNLQKQREDKIRTGYLDEYGRMVFSGNSYNKTPSQLAREEMELREIEEWRAKEKARRKYKSKHGNLLGYKKGKKTKLSLAAIDHETKSNHPKSAPTRKSKLGLAKERTSHNRPSRTSNEDDNVLARQTLQELPTELTDKDRATRHVLFGKMDEAQAGTISMADIKRVLATEAVGRLISGKPLVVSKAFAAALAVPSEHKGDKAAEDAKRMERVEFRFFLLYVRTYFEVAVQFDLLHAPADQRINVMQFYSKGMPMLLERNLAHMGESADQVFGEIDKHHGGQVLFDAFVVWVIERQFKQHCEASTAKQSTDSNFKFEYANLPKSSEKPVPVENKPADDTETTPMATLPLIASQAELPVATPDVQDDDDYEDDYDDEFGDGEEESVPVEVDVKAVTQDVPDVSEPVVKEEEAATIVVGNEVLVDTKASEAAEDENDEYGYDDEDFDEPVVSVEAEDKTANDEAAEEAARQRLAEKEEAERIEAERVAAKEKERAEQLAAEAKADAERIEAEEKVRAAAEAKAKAEADRLEAEQAAAERAAAEAQAEAERIETERVAAENAALDAAKAKAAEAAAKYAQQQLEEVEAKLNASMESTGETEAVQKEAREDAPEEKAKFGLDLPALKQQLAKEEAEEQTQMESAKDSQVFEKSEKTEKEDKADKEDKSDKEDNEPVNRFASAEKKDVDLSVELSDNATKASDDGKIDLDVAAVLVEDIAEPEMSVARDDSDEEFDF